MIFLSHNYKDKVIVESFAIKLREIFGENKVFYDSWSIQPGDGIIDKMNVGLGEYKYFYFFVSENSLKSKMVSLEWQNAIMKHTSNDNIKFIPIKLDDCEMPPILLQNLYIDLSKNSFEVTLRQLVDIAENKSLFQPIKQKFSNLKVYKYFNGDNLILECRAECFMEPISNYLILIENDEDELSFTPKSDKVLTSGFNKNLGLTNGSTCNGQLMSVTRATTPGFPFIAEITPKKEAKIKLIGVMHEERAGDWKALPLVEIDNPKK